MLAVLVQLIRRRRILCLEGRRAWAPIQVAPLRFGEIIDGAAFGIALTPRLTIMQIVDVGAGKTHYIFLKTSFARVRVINDDPLHGYRFTNVAGIFTGIFTGFTSFVVYIHEMQWISGDNTTCRHP